MAGFPKVDKKLTKGLNDVAFVLSSEGDEMDGVYAGSDFSDINGRNILCHHFVLENGVARILSRFNLDKWLKENEIDVGDRVHVKRIEDKEFKKDGEKRAMHQFKCERAEEPQRNGKRK